MDASDSTELTDAKQAADLFQSIHQRMSDYAKQRQEEAAFLQQGLNEGESWFFWCLKGASYSTYSGLPDGWEWPPRLSGRIAAKDKKEVRRKLADEFGEDYPVRVLDKDRVKFPFLLYIEQMKADGQSRYPRRFMPRTCSICHRTYVINDRYSDPHDRGRYGDEVCSNECAELYVENRRTQTFVAGLSGRGGTQAVIYSITHKPTQKRYIGKTTQAFTLRWFQHMYYPGTSEFHQLIRSSDVTDWLFEVIEITDKVIPEHILRGTLEYGQAVLAREQYWIDHYDSIRNGLNSATALSIDPQLDLGLGDMGE